MRHISAGLALALPSRADGREVAVKMVYTIGVSWYKAQNMKLKKTAKRLKKSTKLEATKPLSRAPWMVQQG